MPISEGHCAHLIFKLHVFIIFKSKALFQGTALYQAVRN
jgi:hypothetical protein